MSEFEFFSLLAIILLLAVGIPLVLAYRLWRIWQKARQTNLLWVIVHANLLTTFIVVLVIMIWQGVNTFSTLTHQTPYMKPLFIATGVLLPMLFSAILAIPPIVGVMTLTAFIAYHAAKPTIARLEALGKTMEALQAGDYAVRSTVDGQVELTRLQSGFNDMAAQLEKTLQALKQEKDAINHLLEVRRELFAEVSHELRTPAATLRAYLDTVLMNWDSKPPVTMRQDLEVMSHETDRLQQLLDDLFLLARTEIGQLTLNAAFIDTAVIVNKIVATVAPLAWERGRVRVIAKLPPDLPSIWADADRLEQILHNLLQNAIRHTPPGGIVAIHAFIETDTHMVRLEVRDTGSGINPDELLHIWERYFRGEQTGNTGIGLALVKELTTAMGGTVAVESTSGQGSTFIIRLRYNPNNGDWQRPSHPPASNLA